MAQRPARFGVGRRADLVREDDRRRGSARERGYTIEWDKASARHLRDHPICRYCELGVFGPARAMSAGLTDHLYPHREFPGVFWVERLWVSSCTRCHSGPKQALEREGKAALDRLARDIGVTPWPAAGEGGV